MRINYPMGKSQVQSTERPTGRSSRIIVGSLREGWIYIYIYNILPTSDGKSDGERQPPECDGVRECVCGGGQW